MVSVPMDRLLYVERVATPDPLVEAVPNSPELGPLFAVKVTSTPAPTPLLIVALRVCEVPTSLVAETGARLMGGQTAAAISFTRPISPTKSSVWNTWLAGGTALGSSGSKAMWFRVDVLTSLPTPIANTSAPLATEAALISVSALSWLSSPSVMTIIMFGDPARSPAPVENWSPPPLMPATMSVPEARSSPPCTRPSMAAFMDAGLSDITCTEAVSPRKRVTPINIPSSASRLNDSTKSLAAALRSASSLLSMLPLLSSTSTISAKAVQVTCAYTLSGVRRPTRAAIRPREKAKARRTMARLQRVADFPGLWRPRKPFRSYFRLFIGCYLRPPSWR